MYNNQCQTCGYTVNSVNSIAVVIIVVLILSIVVSLGYVVYSDIKDEKRLSSGLKSSAKDTISDRISGLERSGTKVGDNVSDDSWDTEDTFDVEEYIEEYYNSIEDDVTDVIEEDTTFKIGDSVTLDNGAVYTVTGCTTHNDAGELFSIAESKNEEYLIVSVTIENKGKDILDYNTYDFNLLNNSGVIKDPTIANPDLENALHSDSLAPGGSISGTVAFEIPIGDVANTLLIMDYGDPVAKISLN